MRNSIARTLKPGDIVITKKGKVRKVTMLYPGIRILKIKVVSLDGMDGDVLLPFHILKVVELKDINCSTCKWNNDGCRRNIDCGCLPNIPTKFGRIAWEPKPNPKFKNTRSLSSDQVIQEIVDVLSQGDGEFIEKIANQVLVPHVQYKGDSIFTQTINP